MNAPHESPRGPAPEQGFQLGDLEIDPAAGDVSGPGGREQLDPKVMEVLLVLAHHAGQVVLREDLLARIWPNTVVTDDALSRCIYNLRRQLSQAGGDERYKSVLETLPKRGYRLNGEVTWMRAPPKRRPRARRRLATMLGVVAAAAVILWLAVSERAADPAAEPPGASAPRYSIAVLPFVDMSEGKDQQYLSDGVTEEILDRLARSGRLRVIARTSSFAFAGERVDIPRIADALDVSHVLEGSVRRSGDRIRITAQLVDTASNSHVWSETYERTLGDLFAVQDDIATSVAGALQVALADTAPTTPSTPAAYERYLQGEFFYNRRAPGDIERSVEYFREALAIDPEYARAWAALSGAYALLSWDDVPSAGAWRARQGEAAHRAVELDPNLAVAHVRLALYYFGTGDRERARDHMKRARVLDPDDPLVLGFAAGRHRPDLKVDEAVAEYRRLVARDPLSVMLRSNFAHVLVRAGRLDEASSELHRVRELSPGAGPDVDLTLARIRILQRRHDEAYEVISRLPDDGLRDLGTALLYHGPGRRAEADAALRRLAAKPVDIGTGIAVAEAYAIRGRHAEAFASLKRTRQMLEGDQVTGLSRVWHLQEEMLISPFLVPLHRDPRWTALMAD